jgi:hypothetical protein
MPFAEMLRNLGRLSASGLATDGSEAAFVVVRRLRDLGAVHGSCLHPLAIPIALRAYGSGCHRGRAR